MPLKMLTGIRKKVIDNYKQEKSRKLNEDIQYDSLAKIRDFKFIEKKLQEKKNKNNFMKNKYKFKDMKSKGFGNFKDGVLHINDREAKHLNKSK